LKLSKFDRYKKDGESYYVYPHKHCQKCGQMIEENLTYCSECYNKLQERKKKKKKFRLGKRNKKSKDSQDKQIIEN
jgi:predicted amidophosphoribosyltransferase